MIKLTKQSEPQWLVDNSVAKTNEYIAAPPNHKPNPWRNAEVVDALKSECRNKCMYCEQLVDDTGYSAVEHIRPKSQFPSDVLKWDNLGLACGRCNTNKGEYYTGTEELRLLDPYIDCVADHLQFKGPLTVAAPSSSRGQNTVRKLKLTQRTDLVFARMIAIEKLDDKLRLWHNEANAEKKELFREDVLDDLAPLREHSGVLRTYAVEFGFELI